MRVPTKAVALFAMLLSPALTSCNGPTDPDDPVEHVLVTPAKATIAVGDFVQLIATALTERRVLTGATASWITNDSVVIAITSYGTVVGMASGTATVSATKDGISGSSEIVVYDPTVRRRPR